MSLFDPIRLELFATEHAPSTVDAQQALLVLRRLIARRLDGSLTTLTETRVEQSFNERVFAEVFDYESVLRRGSGEFHVMAKNYYPAEGEARKGADDLALGFFGPDRETPEIHASVELKDPGQDLDAPEPSYQNRSPVRQAFDRVRGRGIPWILVSNLFEMRLYSADDDRNYELISLTDVISVAQFTRAYALLSRRTLLGDPGSKFPRDKTAGPPLLRLLHGGPPHMLVERPDSLRLVHEAFTPGGADLPLHELEDGLLAAFKRMPSAGEYGAWPPHVPNVMALELEDDRLVLAPDVGGGVIGRLEFSKNGILRVTEYLDPQGEDHRTVRGADLANRVALFILFARNAFDPCTLNFKWRLLDLAGSQCIIPSEWIDGGRTQRLGAGPATAASSAHAEPGDLRLLNDGLLVEHVTAAIRDLLFPYRHVADVTRSIFRVRMSKDHVRAVIAPALGVLAAIRQATEAESDAAVGAADLRAALREDA